MKPNGSLRIAHISDTHLGYRALYKVDPVSGRNQRSIDIERAYERAIDDILERDVDLVIHAGDVFHHTRPAWSAIRSFVSQTRRITDRGIPMLVIAGNHDTPRLRTSGSVFSVMEIALPGVAFVTGYTQETISYDQLGLMVAAVPHGKLADPLPPMVIPVPGVRNILLTHGLVGDLRLSKHTGEPGEEVVPDYLLQNDFDYIALGDFHLHCKVRNNAWYAGSTERMGWGDHDADPGYALVEFSDADARPEVTHVPIESRPMTRLAPLDCAEKSAREIADIVLQRIERDAPPEGMARIEFRDAIRPIRREAEAILRREAADLVWSLEIRSPNDILAPFDDARPELGVTDIFSLFDEFTAGRQYTTEFETEFRSKGRRALEAAAQKLELISAVEDSGS